MAESEEVREQVKNLPDQPGIYKFFSEEGELIYVGKAKSLKKRVSNYFNKNTGVDNKTRKLVSQIRRIEFTIVNTEFDALLLENSLIKNNQPKYNILLKDDKTYPYIYVSRERFPRVIATRTFDKSLGTYYGPYTSVKAMNSVLDLIHKLFFIRTCTFNLSEKNVNDGKYKVCLEFHIGNCKGPCEGLVTEEIYSENIDKAHQILKGHISVVKTYYKDQIQEAAENLEFEKAHKLKLKFDLLEKFQTSSVIVNPKITDLDVFTIKSLEKNAFINYLHIVNGAILQTKNLEIKKKLDETDEDLLKLAIIGIREEMEVTTRDIIANIPVEIDELKITVPSIGDKKKLLDLSLNNIAYQMSKSISNNERDSRILNTMQEDLRLKEKPFHIECFDNSNIQGTNPVASMVVFKNAKPSKKDYRHYNIKTVVGPNDFDSMHEIVHRRYKRVLEEGQPLPNLIVIDGGKGQLSAACQALQELDLYGKIPIVGIAKRLEEIYYPDDSLPLYIDKKSESLKVIQQIRNEAHRFAITFHRTKRSKSTLAKSKLASIKGVGESTFQKLVSHFGSVSKIRQASVEELAEIVGKAKAELVLLNLAGEKESDNQESH
ncbi:excinuclease ABC subunit UvrC [Sporocytophaga myxococcoides]|uniref:excinuclease ABC subunit UvrC n=1 Tax=Sporocytophaga myxococcoides TaxID=153721 RepID=UPI00041149ED|nr:excinuclease ABC subunit UvrC [Sporocytophaga myxococcoides]